MLAILAGPISILFRAIIPGLQKNWLLENVIFAVVDYVLQTLFTFLVFYTAARRDRHVGLRDFMKPLVIALPLQLILGLIFKFAIYITGPAMYIGLVWAKLTMGSDVTWFEGAPMYMAIAPYFLTVALIVLAAFIAYKLAARHNEKERAALTGKNDEQ